MSLDIHFEGTTPPEALRAAVAAEFGLDPAVVVISPPDGLATCTEADPIVLITRRTAPAVSVSSWRQGRAPATSWRWPSVCAANWARGRRSTTAAKIPIIGGR